MPLMPDGTNLETGEEWDQACLPQPLLAYLEPLAAEALHAYRWGSNHTNAPIAPARDRLETALATTALTLGTGMAGVVLAELARRLDDGSDDDPFWSVQRDVLLKVNGV